MKTVLLILTLFIYAKLIGQNEQISLYSKNEYYEEHLCSNEIIAYEISDKNSSEIICINSRQVITRKIDNNQNYIKRKYVLKEKKKDSIKVPNGYYYLYYPSGNISEKGYYKNGERTGTWKKYYFNGQIGNRFKYKKSFLNGKWVTFYNNGTVWLAGKYKNDGRKGLWLEYYPNGIIKEKGRYCDDIDPIFLTSSLRTPKFFIK